MAADLSKIVDDLSQLTVLEAAELSKLLEEKWGVSAAAPMAMAMPAGGGAAAPAAAAAAPTAVTVILTAGGAENKQEAEDIKKKLEDAGAKVEIK